MKVVFILGSGHCGSTLLDMLFGAHPDIVGVGEVHNLYKGALCTCGKRIAECHFWSTVLESIPQTRLDIYRRKLDFLLDRKIFFRKQESEPIDVQAYVRHNERLFDRVLVSSSARVIVDSSKNVDRFAVLTASTELEPVLLHLVRDGRAVTWSYMKKYGHPFRYMLMWLFYNLKVSIVKRRYPRVKQLFVRYEELASSPEQVLRQLLSELNLPFYDEMMQFRQVEQHQVGGNRMKFDRDGIKRDEAWRRDMPLVYRGIFDLTCGWLNLVYYASMADVKDGSVVDD